MAFCLVKERGRPLVIGPLALLQPGDQEAGSCSWKRLKCQQPSTMFVQSCLRYIGGEVIDNQQSTRCQVWDAAFQARK